MPTTQETSTRSRAARLKLQRPRCRCCSHISRTSLPNKIERIRRDESKPTHEPLKTFGPKPLEAWHCVRTQKATTFRGIEGLEARPSLFGRRTFEDKIARFKWKFSTISKNERLPTHAPNTPGNTTTGRDHKLSFWINRILHPFTYNIVQTQFPEPILPPRGRHVVLGIFDESGILLEEVILYAGGPSISKQLVKARRRLFRLPILRDIKSFELYKCDHYSRAHVRVATTKEAQDSLAALFRSVERWERYYRLTRFLEVAEVLMSIPYLDITITVPYMLLILTLVLLRKIKWTSRTGPIVIDQPIYDDEAAWTEWIHENINEGKIDPGESRYSLLCVVGWSRSNIVLFIVLPFSCLAILSVVFGIVWSLDFEGHQGDLSGAWTVASFVITLAAAIAALVGIIGGFAYN